MPESQPGEPTAPPHHASAAVVQILHDPRLLLRVILLLTTSAAVLVLSAWCLLLIFRSASRDMKLEIQPSGAIAFRTRSGTTATFLLTANGSDTAMTPWVDTGLQLRAGDCLEVKASGKVTLALHRMLKAADSDQLPPHPWVGPEGLSDSYAYPHAPRAKDKLRAPLRLAKNQPAGMLIAQITNRTPGAAPSEDTIALGRRLPPTSIPQSGNLWLAVNEIWLSDSPEMHAAYVAGEEDPAEAETRWRDIVGKKYWNAWFDDNAGAFLVSVKVSECGL